MREPTFGPAPENYVAGRGRGATGFSTLRPDMDQADDDEGDDGKETFGDDATGEGLWDYSQYDLEDAEADAIWEAIDKRMDSRRRERREKRAREELEKYRKQRPKIQTQFADLKRELSKVTRDEWENLPEPGDHLRSAKKQRLERYTPVPDSLLEQARLESQHVTAIDPKARFSGLETPGTLSVPGTASTLGITTPFTPLTSFTPHDLRKIGEGKAVVLRKRLESASDSITGQTAVDVHGYLTSLSNMKTSTAAEIDDKKKAELLMDNITATNPKHAPGWIARARLEARAGKLEKARKIIAEGCANCPTNEDVWLEAAKLNPPEEAKAILAKAVQYIPNSVQIWLAAAKLETDETRKKRVLRKALEIIPTSAVLWKAAVELEGPEDARIMLARAVECVPNNVELWLALAKLETYENAKRVLNQAAETLPTERAIWITGAQLEEAHGNENSVRKVIKKAIKTLRKHGVTIDREEWLKEAELCEKSGSIATCQAIVAETIGVGVEEQDRKKTWCDDAEACIARGSIQTARAIYAHATTVYPTKKSLWLRMAQLEKQYGTQESLEKVLAQAVRYCPTSEQLWLRYAKEKWLQNDVNGARQILADAAAANPGSEQIYLAAVKLEKENDEYTRAKQLLEKARKNAGTQRVWMKSALLERQVGHFEECRQLLDEALTRFPKFDKLWLMRAQLEEANNKNEALAIYARGVSSCPNSIPLWICMSRLVEQVRGTSQARATLEQARQTNPNTPDLWLEAIRVEMRAGNKKLAQTLLAKALQECKHSGKLWAEAIEMEAKPQKKARSVDALKNCDNDPYVILAVARLFWEDRKIEKARTWFNRGVTADPDLGDLWAYFLKFEMQHGTEEQQQSVIKRCVAAEPHHGEYWVKISKKDENARLKVDEILKKVVEILP
jgi:pre-mRNA-processing factor 6